MGAAVIGSVALRRCRRFLLVLAIAYNIAAATVLIWIATVSAFRVHAR